jgi:hypothetical protein
MDNDKDFLKGKDRKEKSKKPPTDKLIKRPVKKRAKLPSIEASEMGKPAFKKFQTHEKNPFLVDMVHEGFGYTIAHKKELDGQVAFNYQTGEVGGSLAVGVTKKIDRQEFVKLFTGEISRLMGLSPTAQRIFLVFLAEMQRFKDTDRIHVTLGLINEMIEREGKRLHNSFIKLKPMGKSSYYNAMTELLMHDIIAPCGISRDFYWVNPAKLFNGSRITLVEQYIINENKQELLEHEIKAQQLPPQMDLSESDPEPNVYDENTPALDTDKDPEL